MMRARNAEMIVFDVETTGLSPVEGDRIIEIAAIKVKDFQVVDVLESFINPKRDLPAGAAAVNKITVDMLTDAPTGAEFLPRMIDFIGGGCVVGHNVRFDLGFLCYELSLTGRKLREETPALDTLKMAKALIPYLSSYKLSHIAGAFGITIGDTHRAKADVELTIEVLKRLMDIAGDQNIHDLQDFCQKFSVEKPVYRMPAQVEQGFLF